MRTNIVDFLVIGGGIIGISIARELKSRNRDSIICVLEKEHQCGLHASGRNSGILHAGFYYTADSLKARFTKEGNQRLTEYCKVKNLTLKKCGKLVVAQNERIQKMIQNPDIPENMAWPHGRFCLDNTDDYIYFSKNPMIHKHKTVEQIKQYLSHREVNENY